MKKLVALVLSLTLLLLMAAGAYADEKTTVTICIADNIDEIPAIQAQLDDFYAKNPDIELEWVYLPWESFNDAIIMQLATGSSGYDIINIESSSLAPLVAMGTVASLDPYTSDSFSFDRYYSFVDDYFLTVGDQHYAVPQNPDGRCCLWNRPVIEALGYTEETLPKTLEEYAEYVQKAYDAGYIPQGQRFSYYLGPMMDLGSSLMSDGGSFVALNEEGKWEANLMNDAGLKWMELQRKVAACTPGDNYMTMDTNMMVEGFNNGTIGCIQVGMWFTTLISEEAYNNNLIITNMPSGSAGSMSTVTGNYWIMTEESQVKDAAVKFMEWKNDPRISAITTNGLNGMPDNAEYFPAEKADVLAKYQMQFETGGVGTVPAGYEWLNETAAAMAPVFQEAVLNQELSLEEATEMVNASIQAVIDRNQG